MKVNRKTVKHIKTLEKKIDSNNIQKKVEIGKLSKKINSREVKAKKIIKKFDSIIDKINSTKVKNDNHKLKFFEVGQLNKRLEKLKSELKKVKKEIPTLKIEKNKVINELNQNKVKKEKLESIVEVYESKERNKIEERIKEDLIQVKAVDNLEKGNSFTDSTVPSINSLVYEKVNVQKNQETINENGSEGGAKLLNSWSSEDRENGVEISYEREDGKSFHFEVSKKEGEEVEVNFINNSLSKIDLNKLAKQTDFKING